MRGFQPQGRIQLFTETCSHLRDIVNSLVNDDSEYIGLCGEISSTCKLLYSAVWKTFTLSGLQKIFENRIDLEDTLSREKWSAAASPVE